MKKHLFQKSLLVLIGVLITSLTSQVWAGITVTTSSHLDFYFDPSTTSANWKDHCALAFGNNSSSIKLPLTHISHTNLWYGYLNTNWSDLWWMAAYDADWGTGQAGAYSNYSNDIGAAWVSAQYSSEYTIYGNHITLVTIASGNNHPAITLTDVNSNRNYDYMNYTINLESYVKTGTGDYEKANAKGAISATSYKIYGSHDQSTQTTASLSTSQNTTSIRCARTAETSFSVATPASGYEFVGWYDGNGSRISPDAEYTTYNPTTNDAYVRAYFAQTHTVTFGKEGSGTVSPSGNQTIGQNGVTITASSPSTGYYFAGWTCTGGASVEDASATSTKVTATATGTVTAKFVPIWTIKGSDTEMGNWNEVEDNDLIYVSGTTYSTTIDLVKNKTYQFKVFNRSASGDAQWYGYGSSDAEVTFTRGGTKSRSGLANNTSNLGITTDENLSGTYTFTWNTSGNVISVTYPTPSYTISYRDQGNADFSGTQTSAPTTHTYGTPTTLKIPTKVGYNFAGWWTDAACTSSQVGTNSAATLAADGYTANIILYAKWTAKTYTVALDQEDGTGGLDEIEDVTYGAAMPTIASKDLPSKSNYTFGGYYDGEGGTGTPYYNANGTSAKAWDKDVADPTLYAKWTENTYTVTFANDGHGSTTPTGSQSVGVVTGVAISATPNDGYEFDEWTSSDGGTFTSAATSASNTFKPTANTTVTAKFKIMTYNGTIDKSTDAVGATDGSYSVTYGATTLTATDPEKAGYHVSGYFLDEDCETKIADEEGKLRAKVSIGDDKYTNNDGEWIWNGQPKLYVSWAANTITITLNRNDGSGTTTTTSVSMGTSVYTPAVSALDRAGYDFLGYYTEESGGTRVFKDNGDTDSDASTYIGTYSSWIYPNNITLYAHWEEVELTFDNGDGDNLWSNASNWSPACVPTVEHDVTIAAEATVSGSAVAKSVTIGDGGKVTIQPTGVLEVAGTVTNTDDSKLIINTNSSNQGALIYDISKGSPSATINMTMNYTDGDNFQYIASPVGGARVSSMFSGKGVYTYAWIEGKGWERRGYYDDFMGNEVIVINGQGSCIFSGLLYPSTGGSLSFTTSGEGFNAEAQGVNMIPNTLTAPIKIAAMSFSGSSDNGVHIWQNGAWGHYAPASSAAADAVIPALQGYAVLASSSGSVSFDYDEAVRGASSHNDALRAPKRTATDTPDYMKISVTTNDRKVDLQLSEHAQFTTAIDKGWETIYMEGDGRFGELYALADEKMSILASPDLEGTVLGFVPGEILNYTLSFEGDGKGYYLNDIEEQQSTLIEEGNTYTFSSGNNNAARFIVSRTPINKITTGVDVIYDGVKARKQMIDGVLYIIRDGRMYNARGNRVK